MEVTKRKQIKVLTIGGLLLLLLVISASYAYFAVVTTHSAFTGREAEASAESLGSVSLTSTNNNLSIDLAVVNFAKQTNDMTYYASNSGITTTPTEEDIGTATVVGNGNFNCNYTLAISKSSTQNKDLYDAFQNMSTKSTEQIVLTIDGTKYDFNTANLFNNFTHSGVIEGVSAGSPKTIKAGLYVVDKANTLQNALADKDITLTMTITSFTCSATGIGGKRILANNALKTNLSASKTNDLLGTNTLYRYQGTYTNVTNNYICFNTYDKDLCVNNPGTYMYRILGIAEDGTMKLIKHAALSSTRQWHSASAEASCTGTNCDWEHSTLYAGINGSYFLSTLNTGWSDKIQNVNWKYGDTTSNQGYSAATAFAAENAFGNQVNAKIGLMYMYDYFYANNWDGTQNYGTNESPVRYGTNGWIHRSHTDNNVPNNWEWMITRYGLASNGRYYAWHVRPDGSVGNYWLDYSYSVRPVFYLKSNVNLLGSGTSSDPYMIGG